MPLINKCVGIASWHNQSIVLDIHHANNSSAQWSIGKKIVHFQFIST